MWRKEGKKTIRWVFLGEQRTDDWHRARKFRLTGSRAASALGRGYDTPEVTADYICGRKLQFVNDSMRRGMDKEDDVKRWYEKSHSVTVVDVGFAYFDDYPKLGASPDGLVGEDGMIEIKCPDKMYWKLRARVDGVEYINYQGYPNHINQSHYDQMQMQMAVMERSWCDYVVYSVAEDEVYEERIDFNLKYWRKMLCQLNRFTDKYLSAPECEPWCGN